MMLTRIWNQARFMDRVALVCLFVAILIAMSTCAPEPAGAQELNFDEDSSDYIDTATITNGVYTVEAIVTIGGPPLSVRVVYADDHYADVIFFNTLVPSMLSAETVNFVMSDGNIVTVVMTPRGGPVPDTMTVLPPPGYIAIPSDITVDEFDTGTIEIHKYTGF